MCLGSQGGILQRQQPVETDTVPHSKMYVLTAFAHTSAMSSAILLPWSQPTFISYVSSASASAAANATAPVTTVAAAAGPAANATNNSSTGGGVLNEMEDHCKEGRAHVVMGPV
jgi:hypothetical protein